VLPEFKRRFLLAAARAVRPLTGRNSIEDHAPDDVFVAGFPKSGNTWFQYLMAGVLGGIDAASCPDHVVQDLMPDAQSRLIYRRQTKPVFFKTHDLPRPRYRRVIYLLRDGRDAMVSYFHHYNALFPPVDFPTLVRTAPRLPAKWHAHVEAWLANPHGADLIVVKYEDLKRDTVAELRRVCTFAGLTVDDARLRQATEGASFANMKSREQRLGWADPAWPKDQPFVRRGVVGSFRNEMPADALALFLAEAGPTLQKNGYTV
jgi:Sulfotransferase domain